MMQKAQQFIRNSFKKTNNNTSCFHTANFILPLIVFIFGIEKLSSKKEAFWNDTIFECKNVFVYEKNINVNN